MAITPLPQVLQSLGLLERVAYEVQTQPELSAQTAQSVAVQTMKQESDQIEKTEPGKEDEKVSLDGRQERKNGARRSRPRKRDKKNGESRPDNPWSGNLLNVRI